jgi:hypothetical protein
VILTSPPPLSALKLRQGWGCECTFLLASPDLGVDRPHAFKRVPPHYSEFQGCCLITEAENIIVPGQDGGRSGRGVDLNQLKLDWITSEAQRLKQRIIRIDIDFKNAFNSMSQDALWAVMRAYNIPDVDLLEAIYSRTTASSD